MVESTLGTVKVVMVMFLTLAVIAIAIFLATSSLTDTFDITTTSASNNTILADNASAQTLSYLPSNTPTANSKNTTWINFDGSNDFLNITDDSYQTVSFWYKNATTGWRHIVNTSGILYQDGVEVATVTLYPLHWDGDDWYFGRTGTSSYLNVSIDEIRFYDDTINITEVTTIFNNGR